MSPGAPAKQLARETGLPLATAYHLLRTLVHDGYLRKLADGDSPTGTTTARRFETSRATLQSALRDLAREGQHVTRDELPSGWGPWRYVDPLLGLWVRSRGRPL